MPHFADYFGLTNVRCGRTASIASQLWGLSLDLYDRPILEFVSLMNGFLLIAGRASDPLLVYGSQGRQSPYDLVFTLADPAADTNGIVNRAIAHTK